MEDAPAIEDKVYAEFYDVDEPVIKFLGGINEVQHIQRQLSEVAEEQANDEVWSEVIKWVRKGHALDKSEVRGKLMEFLVARSQFNPTLFKIRDGVLMYTKSENRNQTGEVGRICIPETMVKEVWSLCHQSDSGGYRGIDGTLHSLREDSSCCHQGRN